MDLQNSIYMSKIRDVGDGLEKEEKGDPPGFFPLFLVHVFGQVKNLWSSHIPE